MGACLVDVDAAEQAGLRLSLLHAEARLAATRDRLWREQTARQALAREAAEAIRDCPPPGIDPAEHERLRDLVQRQYDEIAHLRHHLEAFRSSAVWRATWPLRRVLGHHPGLARNGRRVLRGAWWLVTLQAPARLRQRSELLQALKQGSASPPPEIVPLQPEEPELLNTPLPAEAQPEPEPVWALPISDAPLVSIIVPAYGQVPVTLRCLRAIAASETRTAFEVIVAEDASGDPQVTELEGVRGLRLVKNPSNLGFLHNCNEAALAARGHYLLFLNNDTEPMPGFLDALVLAAEAFPLAGLVGSKLLFPDGRLQEAGGIVWQDGTGWNYGRGDDPSLPQYNTIREVDYVSGASILLRRALFEELRGFDPVFAPAYYEDTDLAFRIRARGLRVIYQPASVVIHHEGVSHGTDITSGVKANQEANRHRFVSRWPRLLATEHMVSGTDLMRAQEHARGRPTILIIDHYVPEPDRDAGSRSTMAIVSALRESGWVVKFWPQNRACTDYTPLLETMGVEVLDGRLPVDFETWMTRNGAELDHVLTMRPTVATEFVSGLLRHTKARLSFYGHDIHHVRMRRQALLLRDPLLAREADEMERLERRLWGLFDVTLYPSAIEAETVRRLVPGAAAHPIVLFCYDRFRSRGRPPAEPVILFVAGFAHPPNIDAAQWLVAEILPLVQAELPLARLVLAGSHPTPAVLALAGDSIVVTGSLSDDALAVHYADARAAIVPLRVGAGVKGKVVEALQQGLPLVTTTIGAEGIPGVDQVVAVADEAADLAAALVTLLRDDGSWTRQAAAQIDYASRHFSRAALAASLHAALEAPASAPTGVPEASTRPDSALSRRTATPVRGMPSVAARTNVDFIAR